MEKKIKQEYRKWGIKMNMPKIQYLPNVTNHPKFKLTDEVKGSNRYIIRELSLTVTSDKYVSKPITVSIKIFARNGF